MCWCTCEPKTSTQTQCIIVCVLYLCNLAGHFHLPVRHTVHRSFTHYYVTMATVLSYHAYSAKSLWWRCHGDSAMSPRWQVVVATVPSYHSTSWNDRQFSGSYLLFSGLKSNCSLMYGFCCALCGSHCWHVSMWGVYSVCMSTYVRTYPEECRHTPMMKCLIIFIVFCWWLNLIRVLGGPEAKQIVCFWSLWSHTDVRIK